MRKDSGKAFLAMAGAAVAILAGSCAAPAGTGGPQSAAAGVHARLAAIGPAARSLPGVSAATLGPAVYTGGRGATQELYLLPRGIYYFKVSSDIGLMADAYDRGSWTVRDGRLLLTRRQTAVSAPKPDPAYAIFVVGEGPEAASPRIASERAIADASGGVSLDAISLRRVETLTLEKAAALAAQFDETNRQSEVFVRLQRLGLDFTDAEVVDGSWRFSNGCAIEIDGALFTAQRMEVNRDGSQLKLSGSVRVQVGDVGRDLRETTLFLAGSSIERISPDPGLLSAP